MGGVWVEFPHLGVGDARAEAVLGILRKNENENSVTMTIASADTVLPGERHEMTGQWLLW